jgi:hypothetical protein
LVIFPTGLLYLADILQGLWRDGEVYRGGLQLGFLWLREEKMDSLTVSKWKRRNSPLVIMYDVIV